MNIYGCFKPKTQIHIVLLITCDYSAPMFEPPYYCCCCYVNTLPHLLLECIIVKQCSHFSRKLGLSYTDIPTVPNSPKLQFFPNFRKKKKTNQMYFCVGTGGPPVFSRNLAEDVLSGIISPSTLPW